MQNSIYGSSVYALGRNGGWVRISWRGLGRSQRQPSHDRRGIAGALVVFLNIAATVMVRDGIRDVTLRAAGFEVWDRQVVTNWSVVGLFLVLFVAALGAIGYLIRVVARARRIKETYA